MLEWGDLLLTQGGPHRHRAVAQILQHGTTAQRVGISPSRARELDRGRMKPSGSLQCWCGARASNAGACPTPPSRSNPSLYSLTNWYKIPVRPFIKFTMTGQKDLVRARSLGGVERRPRLSERR